MINNSPLRQKLPDNLLLAVIHVLTFGLLLVSNEKAIRYHLWLALVVSGTLLYLTGLDQVVWVPYLVGLVVYLRLLNGIKVRKSSLIFWFLFSTFVVYLLLHSAIFFNSLKQVLVGYKIYLILWSFAIFVAFSGVSPEALNRIWKVLFSIASLQLIFSIFQALIIVPMRGGDNPWDAVVGTFGGDPFYGGNSGGMAIFLLFIFSAIMSLRKAKLISKYSFYKYVVICLGPIFLAEVKVAVILIPLVVIATYYNTLIQNPLKGLVVVAASICMACTLLLAYQYTHYSKNYDMASVSDVFEYAFAELDRPDEYYNERTGEMGRLTAYNFWDSYVDQQPFQKRLLGYGVAETRDKSSAYTGRLADQFFYSIGSTSLLVILWELGIVGLLIILSLIIYLIYVAFNLSNDRDISLLHRSYLSACGVGALLILATLPYNKSFIDTPMIQILFMWCLGYVFFWKNRERGNW